MIFFAQPASTCADHALGAPRGRHRHVSLVMPAFAMMAAIHHHANSAQRRIQPTSSHGQSGEGLIKPRLENGEAILSEGETPQIDQSSPRST
jgi:hypothetical protein